MLLKSAIDFAKASGHKDAVKRLHEIKQHLLEGKLLVVVAGEAKQGKSSLINAYLREPGLFPVDVDIATNLVSTITYGDSEKITVALGEQGKEKRKEISRADISDYVTEQGNQKNNKQARLLEIESPNPQLKEGLLLVDTPGVGSLNAKHTDITYAYVPSADSILFVSDVYAPLSTKELNFIQQISKHCQNFIFVVTKADAVSNYKEIIDSNREKLVKTLPDIGESLPIVPVSSSLSLAYLDTEDPDDLEDSNFAALEQELWLLLGQQRGKILILRALTEFGRLVADLKSPLQAEWEACQNLNQEEKAKLESNLRDLSKRLKQLQTDSAAWQYQLNDGIQDIKTAIFRKFNREVEQIKRRSQEYMEDSEILDAPPKIAGLLENDFDSMMSILTKELSQRAGTLHIEIVNSTGLDMNPLAVDSLARINLGEGAAQVQSLEGLSQVEAAETSLWKKSIEAATRGRFKAMGGVAIGSLLGGTLGGIAGLVFGGAGAVPGAQLGAALGAFLGGARGLTDGIRDALSHVKERDHILTKREISRIIHPYIVDNHSSCKAALEDMITNLSKTMRSNLHQQIKQEKEICDRSLSSFQKTIKLSQNQMTHKIAELKGPLQQLTSFQNAAEQLAIQALEEPESATVSTSAPAASSADAASSSAPATPQPVTANADYGDWADG
ncbi:hypothetical protein S7335_169 [Synechococcus sp. PCC 7335]|nr:hypothetical protein S7335_169 [Synechococcus sp. PCC 7335]